MKTRLLLAGATTLFLSIVAIAQYPQGGGGGMPGGGRGGRSGGMGFDPNVIFNMMAKGKEVIVVDELDDRTKSRMAPMLQAMGITNGQITRDQYAQAFEKMRSGGFGAMTAPATSPTGSASPSTITLSPGSGRPGFSGGGPGGTDYSGGGSDAFAESMFRRLDKNNDGVLDADEMPESLRAEKEKWDTNKDGVIDPTEFKAFFAARLLALQTERAANQNAAAASDPEDEHDKKPVIYRSGKLPKELPDWFVKLDTDGDMQIGLYEWKKSGRSIKEFRDMDRNGDNFLTVDEVLYYVKSKAIANGTAVASNGPGTPGGMGAFPGGFNGPGAAMYQQPGGGMPSYAPSGDSGAGRSPFGRGPGGFGGDRSIRDPGGDRGGQGSMPGMKIRGDRGDRGSGAPSDGSSKDKSFDPTRPSGKSKGGFGRPSKDQ